MPNEPTPENKSNMYELISCVLNLFECSMILKIDSFAKSFNGLVLLSLGSNIFLACCEDKLDKINIEWKGKKSLCIVICSKGYPGAFKKNVEIENLSKIKLDKDEYLFHAGTLNKENKVYAIGGRVLNFVSLSEDFRSARDEIINNVDKLNWDGGFYRKDIGYKVID